jgi:chromosome segregation ATPase
VKLVPVFDSKAAYLYWHEKVEFRNEYLIALPDHVETYTLRHECTNYDDLMKSYEVQKLKGFERGLAIAVIKYQCTSRVLQRRVTRLREQMDGIARRLNELDAEIERRSGIIQALQEIIFRKDKRIRELERQIARLKYELSELSEMSKQTEAYENIAYQNLHTILENLKQRYKEIAQKNRSLGGKVAHIERYKRERDEARARAEQAEQQLNALMEQLNEESSF